MRIWYARRSGKKGKTVLIDEFCEVTGHDREYGIKPLTRNRGAEESGGARGRPKTYGAGELTVPKEIWFLAERPTRDEWQRQAATSDREGTEGYHARVQLARLDRGEALAINVRYSVETWAFGDSLAMVFLGGWVVVDYSLRLKRELDRGTPLDHRVFQ
ncbi:hypothetical protein N9B57_05195 [Verrucomicrobia bacterium]|jgi:hypothetical protein|nr:hypothetical protein [Verrucomicrobiota bacterium]MDA7867317.1 hypothetical protein [Verrucomicrobiota bacterium]MDB4746201.1 hypothetical protein [Verrucomicrobiota bacterium]MDB4798427.1 hypothetical protein [Verrucomicrobiota bacterium]